MKTKILSLFAAVGLMASFTACDDHNYISEPEVRGTLSFVDFGVSVDESQALVESSRATTNKPDVSTFLVTVISKKTNKPVVGQNLNRQPFGKLPGVVDLEVGDYTIVVESHKPEKYEFDKPYYYGEKNISIIENTITNSESIKCYFNSVRVSVRYSDKITPLLGDDVMAEINYGNGAIAQLGCKNTSSVYFAPVDGANTLIVTIRGTVNGQSVNQQKTFGGITPGCHYSVLVRVLGPQDVGDETGMINPGDGVSVDTRLECTDATGNVDVKEEILDQNDRPGQESPEEPNNPDDPTPPGDDDAISITSDTFNMEIVNDAVDGQEYIVNIATDNGLKHVNVEIISNYLNEDFMNSIGMTTKFDLAYPGAYEVALADLKLPVGEDVIDKTSIDFNLTELIPLLNSDENLGQHTFILTVVDNKDNKKSKTLVFQSVEPQE